MATGDVIFPSALATWLSELPAVGDTHGCAPVATSMLTVWLQALADISAVPHACTFHLQPVYHAINGVLEYYARSYMHGGTCSHGTRHMHAALIDPIAKLCCASPLATSVVLTGPPRGMNLLVASLAGKFAAQLGVAAGTVAPDTAVPMRAARCAAFRGASDMMHAMSALAVVRANQRSIMATGAHVYVSLQPNRTVEGEALESTIQ